MQSTITERGQTVVPAPIRKMFHLSPADRLEWLVDGDSIRVLPVPADAVQAFRGQGAGGATRKLLAERQLEVQKEAKRAILPRRGA